MRKDIIESHISQFVKFNQKGPEFFFNFMQVKVVLVHLILKILQ